jgi:hypothetical protein
MVLIRCIQKVHETQTYDGKTTFPACIAKKEVSESKISILLCILFSFFIIYSFDVTEK